MRLTAIILAAQAALCATAIQASAEEVAVGQAGKMFNPDTLQIKAGDSVKFTNDDKVAHAVLVEGPVVTNVGQIKIGEAKSVSFSQAGTYEVKCAIHPKMKLTITVQ
ncbi:cupredoxin domain-containing protein [Dongia deserti]|uniref:cupredoxin domain-containing protein n=1 Tax=Dongia deserti TaxID=2268030 RepID=UPI000E656ADC|nr:cupredoxin domain-containing protein [Dongia deserti]